MAKDKVATPDVPDIEVVPVDEHKDSGERRRWDDIPKQTMEEFKTSLAEAETEADDAHAFVAKAVASLRAKIVKLNGTVTQYGAHGVEGKDLERLGVLQGKLSALDPTSPEVLPPK